MSCAPTLRAELAAAVRSVNAAYYRLPEPRPEAARFDPLDREVDAALAADDPDRARRAIEAWRTHWLELLGAEGDRRC